MFKITNLTGFQMHFENGLNASVQWGPATYTENWQTKNQEEIITSKTAEVMIWSDEGDVCHVGEESVIGWLTSDKVAKLLFAAQSAPNLDFLKDTLEELDFFSL